MSETSIGQDEATWGLIAWIIPLVGAIVALVLRPEYRYAKYWAYLNLSFFIAIVVGGVIAAILALIPFIGWLIGILIWIALLIVWVLGIVKSVSKVYWKPPIIYDLAKALGIETV